MTIPNQSRHLASAHSVPPSHRAEGRLRPPLGETIQALGPCLPQAPCGRLWGPAPSRARTRASHGSGSSGLQPPWVGDRG